MGCWRGQAGGVSRLTGWGCGAGWNHAVTYRPSPAPLRWKATAEATLACTQPLTGRVRVGVVHKVDRLAAACLASRVAVAIALPLQAGQARAGQARRMSLLD